MNFDRAALKTRAKQTMKATRPRPLWVCLVLSIISLLLSALSLGVNGTWEVFRRALTDPDSLTALLYGQVGNTSFMSWFLGLALNVMDWVIRVGFVIYVLRVWRKEESGFGNLFDGFGVFFRAVWITLLPSLLLSLWSLIYALPTSTIATFVAGTYGLEAALWVFVAGLPLLIPVVMAAYSYRQATYLMLDNPSLSCWQCVSLSRRIMRGHRWELFKLDLSFLGWSLLCTIPFVALWVVPYMNITLTGYYEHVLEDFTARNAPPVNDGPPFV